MQKWGPQWMDITWGAGGTTSDLTPAIAGFIQNECHRPCLMHLTCTNMEKQKIDDALSLARKINLRNILALRGDPPRGAKEWKAIDSSFTCALDLIKYIKSEYKDYFSIVVSGYPEGHPNVRHKITDENWTPQQNEPKYWALRRIEDGKAWEGVSMKDWEGELQYVKEKVQHGGQAVITQLFYDAELFLEFVKQLRAIGVTVPILPGIMPIRNYGLFKRMTDFCKTVIPEKLFNSIEAVKNDDTKVLAVGMEWIMNMCHTICNSDLNIPGVHIYTMNTEETTAMILDGLNLVDPKTVEKSLLKVREELHGFKQMTTF